MTPQRGCANGVAADEYASRVAGLSSDLLCVADARGFFLWLNPAWERLLGWRLDELMSRPFVDFVHPHDVARTAAETACVADEHYELASFENRYRCRDGSWRWLEWHAYSDGAHWYGSARDVTARKQAEERLRMQAGFLDQVGTAIVVTDLDGRVLEWNQAAERMADCAGEGARGRKIDAWLAPCEAGEDLARSARSTLMEMGTWDGEVWLRRGDGSRFLAHLRASLFHDDDGAPAGVVAACVDVTERREEELRLHSAQTFVSAVTRQVADGLFTTDVEGRLTSMNPAAESMLGWTEAELRGKVMHDVTHYARPDGSRFPIEQCPISQTRSQGFAVTDVEDTFFRADGTPVPVRYSSSPFAGEDGVPGTVVVFSDESDRHARDMQMRDELEALGWIARIRAALELDRFVLYAQPIIDLATGHVIRHELLLRMLSDDGSVIAPGAFLPTAERYGLIGDIDRWVIDEAIRVARGGHAVQLNVSAESLADHRVLDRIRTGLREHDVDPALLVVEITETALITDEAAAREFAEQLEAIGCGLALDDFGTGYGGFTYLKQLPVRYLKIDREFVGDLAHNPASRHVVEAIVNLSRGFGLGTIAEGVEDNTALEILRSAGVEFAQGFLISRPHPVEEIGATKYASAHMARS